MPTKFIPFTDDPSIVAGLDIRGLTNGGGDIPDVFNGYFDVYQGATEERRKFKLVQRPQTADTAIALNTTNADQVINGMISSLDNTKLYFVLTGTGGPLFRYWDGAVTNNVAMTAGWSNTIATYFMDLDGISYGAGNYFVATDFTKGAVLTAAGVWTEISDATYTALASKTNILPLNGYLYCGSGTTNRIYSSDLNVPGTWGDLAYVVAAAVPGQLLWLQKLGNYLIAFKQYSIEFFEDVGNPTPGSALEAQPQLHRNLGLFSVSSVQEVFDGIIFIGSTSQGKISVYKIDRNSLAITDIANAQVQYGLTNYFSAPAWFSPYITYGSSAANHIVGASQVFPYRNKEFYMLSLLTSVAYSQTMVYDNNLKLWTRWFTHLNDTANTDGIFVPSQCCMLKTSSTYSGPIFAKNYNGSGTTYASKIQAVAFPPTLGDSASFGFTTDFIDLDTTQTKFLDGIEVIYELESETATEVTAGTMMFKYFDKSFQGSGSTTDSCLYQATGAYRIIFRRKGPFRSRAFSFWTSPTSPTAAGATPTLTILGCELTYNVGETDQE